MPLMRAKLKVNSVTQLGDTHERVTFSAVAKKDGYPEDGSDENNTYAKWSPQATLDITIANPALFGKFHAGKEFYVDFTEAD